MAFIMTTTGTQTPVVFNDLGGVSYPHPTSGYDLEGEFAEEEIRKSADIQKHVPVSLSEEALNLN